MKDQKFCSINTKISDVIVDYFSSYYPNVFILKTSIGIGLYDAGQDIWLIPCKTSYKEIYYLYEDIFRIKTDDGYRYWDHQSIRLSEIYDYISEPINSDTQKLLLYKNKQLLALTIPGEIFKIQNEEIGKLYQNRYNLRGKDSQYFNDYYENWKFQLGADYYHYYDDNSLHHFATDLVKQGNIRDALPLLQLGTNREHPRMMTELGIIYAEQENMEFYNIDEAFKLYTKAADLDDEWALNNLGTFYQAGLACKQDINKAIALYAKAAKLGNGLGWSNLADLYYYGELVEQDYDKAEQYYLMAQKLYHYNEDKLTEIYYSKGDFKKVIPLLKKDYEEIFSPIYYGILYENGYGLKTNLKKAILYYEKALTIAPYAHAVQRLLFHYQKCSPIANEPRFNQLLEYAREHEIEINQQEIGLETPKKDSFFKKLFKK